MQEGTAELASKVAQAAIEALLNKKEWAHYTQE
jgi:hypothetical protein